MPTTVPLLQNLQAGQTTTVSPTSYADIGNHVVAGVLFNNSPVILTVTGQFGQRLLQPNTEDLFPVENVVSQLIVTPTTIAAANTYLGVIASTFYYQGDELPEGLPSPLTPFPGGLAQITQGIAPGGYLNVPAAGLVFQPPPNTAQLYFVNFVKNNNYTTTITGVQSGTVYYTTTSTVATPGSILTVTINSAIDTSYIIQSKTGGLPVGGDVSWQLLFAVPLSGSIGPTGLAVGPTATLVGGEVGGKLYPWGDGGNSLSIPQFATSTGQVNVSTVGTTTIIAAPATGANYLFGIDMVPNAGTGTLNLYIGTAVAGNVIAQLSTQAPISPTENLNGFRVVGAVIAQAFTATQFVVIRYAPGP